MHLYTSFDTNMHTHTHAEKVRKNKEYIRPSNILLQRLSVLIWHMVWLRFLSFLINIIIITRTLSGLCYYHFLNCQLDNIFLPSLWRNNFLKIRYIMIHILIKWNMDTSVLCSYSLIFVLLLATTWFPEQCNCNCIRQQCNERYCCHYEN